MNKTQNYLSLKCFKTAVFALALTRQNYKSEAVTCCCTHDFIYIPIDAHDRYFSYQTHIQEYGNSVSWQCLLSR